MVSIISRQGYPKSGQILARVEYFIRTPLSEGGILIIGKDSSGREYIPKHEQKTRGLFPLPSNSCYGVSMGSDPEKSFPCLYFPFQLKARHTYPNSVEEIDTDGEFQKNFEMTLMDDTMQVISPLESEVEDWFKFLACWGPYELDGKLSNHFWGEMYHEMTPPLEIFLENYRV